MAEHKVSKVTVIGSGSWGMGICGLLAHHAGRVVVWSHEEEVATSINACHRNPLQLKDYTLPDNVYATNSYEEALIDTEAVVVVVPSAFLRATCRAFAPFVDEYVPILVLTKYQISVVGSTWDSISVEGSTVPVDYSDPVNTVSHFYCFCFHFNTSI